MLSKYEEFNISLSDSIQKFIDFNRENNKYIWYLSNVDISEALAVELYFSMLSKVDYFYRQYKKNKPISNHWRYKTDVFNLMLKRSIEPVVVEEYVCCDGGVLPKNGALTKIILLYATSLKHFMYIEYILNIVDYKPCIIVKRHDDVTIKYLKKKNYQYICIETFF